MKSLIQAIALVVLLPFLPRAQQSKKADKKIEAALKTHIANLSDGSVKSSGAYSKKASAYLVKQFEKSGLKPGGQNGNWYQKFTVDKGRFFLPSSSLSVNGKSLKLADDFFPFYFSVNRDLRASVAMALAEDGVPWFIPLTEIFDTSNTHAVLTDTLGYILSKADKSAGKGAAALIVFNNATGPDLTFTPRVPSKLSTIPVVYVTGRAAKKYLADESESLDIKLHTALDEHTLTGEHVIGYIDNGADTTLAIGASLTNNENIAALIEISRALKKKKKAGKNYLFVVTEHPEATEYFTSHPFADKKNMQYVMNLDTFSSQGLRNGLNKVKGVMELVEQR